MQALAEQITDIFLINGYNDDDRWIEIKDLTQFQLSKNILNSYFQLILQKNGKYKLFIKWFHIYRNKCPDIDMYSYNLYLPYILESINATFWTPKFHTDLLYYVYNDNDNDNDNDISPCHQIVCTTLMCNEYYKFSLPIMVLTYIMEFFPQIDFRSSKYNHIRKYSNTNANNRVYDNDNDDEDYNYYNSNYFNYN